MPVWVAMAAMLCSSSKQPGIVRGFDVESARAVATAGEAVLQFRRGRCWTATAHSRSEVPCSELRHCRGGRCEKRDCPARLEFLESQFDVAFPWPGDSSAALAVWRAGQGSHEHLYRVALDRAEAACQPLGSQQSDGNFGALEAGERLYRGGSVSIEGDRLAIDFHVYGPDDPGCCPSRGRLRLRYRVAGRRLQHLESDRVGSP